jgi:hypothetical protein
VQVKNSRSNKPRNLLLTKWSLKFTMHMVWRFQHELAFSEQLLGRIGFFGGLWWGRCLLFG